MRVFVSRPQHVQLSILVAVLLISSIRYRTYDLIPRKEHGWIMHDDGAQAPRSS
jgi:hypothetical protein